MNKKESLEKKRKQLIFRSWHRGTKEMDLIMGSFADKYIMSFEEQDLALYEEVLECSDPDLYNWITDKEDIPAQHNNKVMIMLYNHKIVQ